MDSHGLSPCPRRPRARETSPRDELLPRNQPCTWLRYPAPRSWDVLSILDAAAPFRTNDLVGREHAFTWQGAFRDPGGGVGHHPAQSGLPEGPHHDHAGGRIQEPERHQSGKSAEPLCPQGDRRPNAPACPPPTRRWVRLRLEKREEPFVCGDRAPADEGGPSSSPARENRAIVRYASSTPWPMAAEGPRAIDEGQHMNLTDGPVPPWSSREIAQEYPIWVRAPGSSNIGTARLAPSPDALRCHQVTPETSTGEQSSSDVARPAQDCEGWGAPQRGGAARHVRGRVPRRRRTCTGQGNPPTPSGNPPRGSSRCWWHMGESEAGSRSNERLASDAGGRVHTGDIMASGAKHPPGGHPGLCGGA